MDVMTSTVFLFGYLCLAIPIAIGAAISVGKMAQIVHEHE